MSLPVRIQQVEAPFRPAMVEEPEVLEMMRSGPPRKWERGSHMSLLSFDDALSRGAMFWYQRRGKRGRAVDSGYVGSWGYRYIRHLVFSGELCLARQREEYRDWLRRELLGEP
jgi:hypothetical protein